MTSGLAMLAHWPVRQKLNHVTQAHNKTRNCDFLCVFFFAENVTRYIQKLEHGKKRDIKLM